MYLPLYKLYVLRLDNVVYSLIPFYPNGFNDCGFMRDLKSVKCALITQILKFLNYSYELFILLGEI